MSLIKVASRYGDPREQARNAPTYSPQQMEALAARFESFLPGLSKSSGPKTLFDSMLPDGASWDPIDKKANGGYSIPGMGSIGGGGGTMVTQQRPYQPEFESPDRQQYPVHRILANRYWRLFYKLDPVVGSCIDMFSDLPWSNFELTGEGVEGEVKQSYEKMCEMTRVLTLLPFFVKEFLVTGEVVPHLFFDEAEGIWTYIAIHNPDQLEVIDAPFIKMDPIVEFIPDNRLRRVLETNNPAVAQIRKNLPPEIMSRLQGGQNIPLSSVNSTFIARKMHPYDTRGTSILSRLWRIFMYEDAVFNASIQTARRHAGPLKVAKLGNPQTGWIPGPDHEQRLLQLLAQAEVDPNAWLVYHFGIQFDTIGTTDRMMSIAKEWDVIERIKLAGLGVSKAFTTGEISYASASSSIQVFLQRVLGIRTFFEQSWIYPKFFEPVARMNGWIKPKKNELNHRYRVKRSNRELMDENRYIIPKLVWSKKLDPGVPTDLVNAMVALEGIGVKFSKTSKMAVAGFDFEEETKKIHREIEFEKTFLPTRPGEQQQQPGGGGSGGAPGGGGMPPPPPGEPGAEGAPPGGEPGPGGPPPPGQEGAPPGPAPAAAADGGKDKGKATKQLQELSQPKPKAPSDAQFLKAPIYVDDRYGNWKAKDLDDIAQLFEERDSDDPELIQLLGNEEFKNSLDRGDKAHAFEVMTEYFSDQGYPESDLNALKHVLETEGIIERQVSSRPHLEQMLDQIDDEMGALKDPDFAHAFEQMSANIQKNPVQTQGDRLLVGESTPLRGSRKLSSDISEQMAELEKGRRR